MNVISDEAAMQLALHEAAHAAAAGDVPVGCIIVHQGQIIARAFNRREVDQDPTAHAEMIAMREAANHLSSWRLLDTTMYVTLEPCAMCAGAMVLARIPRVVYGCDDPKAGAVKTLYQIGTDTRLNHRFELTPGVLAPECSTTLSTFFSTLRSKR